MKNKGPDEIFLTPYVANTYKNKPYTNMTKYIRADIFESMVNKEQEDLCNLVSELKTRNNQLVAELAAAYRVGGLAYLYLDDIQAILRKHKRLHKKSLGSYPNDKEKI